MPRALRTWAWRYYGCSPSGALTAFEGETVVAQGIRVRGAAVQALVDVARLLLGGPDVKTDGIQRLRGHLADWLGHHGHVLAPSATEHDRDGRVVLAGKIPRPW
jgi:hypothetical protein